MTKRDKPRIRDCATGGLSVRLMLIGLVVVAIPLLVWTALELWWQWHILGRW